MHPSSSTTATEHFPIGHCRYYKCSYSCHRCYQCCSCYNHYHHSHYCHNRCCCPRTCERVRLQTIQEEEDKWKEENYEGGVGWKVDNIEDEGYTRQEWEEEAAKLENWLEEEKENDAIVGVVEKETKEEVEIEERFSNDVDCNLRELESLGWFGFGQVRKDIIKSLTEGGEVSFVWEGGEVRLEIGEISYTRHHGTTTTSETV